jgi:hypothetical protein
MAVSDLAVFASADMELGLAVLAEDGREDARRFADRCEQLASLAAMVPRRSGHETGATAWTSFVEEVAVARRWARNTAAAQLRLAVRLVRCFPTAHALLREGAMTVPTAERLVTECAGADDDIAREVDRRLSQQAARWAPNRVQDRVRRLLLELDADAAADRAARAKAARSVQLVPLADDQAGLWLSGPAAAVTAWYSRVDAQARAARAAGDPRPLDQLRFDLATASGGHSSPAVDLSDRRAARSVRLNVHVPVTTCLGLADEPGWLDGYGWISAPQVRQWLPVAELRQVCTTTDGRIVDVADRAQRPPPTPAGAREALLSMASQPFEITDKTWRSEPRHDPSPALAEFVRLRDRFADGPTEQRSSAATANLDHDQPWRDDGTGGPTAAWNLRARTRRAHGLKHAGWRANRLPDGTTLWTSPAGRCTRTDDPGDPWSPPTLDAALPDPQHLHHVEAELLRDPGDQPDW